MPTRPGSRGRSGTSSPERVSCRRIVAHRAATLPDCRDADIAICGQFRSTARGSRCAADAGSRPMPAATPARAGRARRSARSPSATSAPSRASTPPTTSASATWATRWEVRLHDARRARAQGRHAPPARRGHRHRRRHLAARCARASCPASRRSRQRRLYARGNLDLAVGFEGLFRLPGRPRRRCCASTTSHARARCVSHADDGRGPRRPAHPRPRRRQELVLRHRRGAQPTATASTRSTCPASAPRSKPRDRALQRRAGSPTTVVERHGRAGHRARPPRRQLDGRPRRDRGRRCATPSASRGARRCCVPPSRSSSAATTRSCGCCAPSSALLPHRFTRGMVDEPVLVDCSPTPTRSTPAWPTSSSTSSSASTARAGARLAFLAAARNIYLDAPFGRGGFYPRLAELAAAGAVRLGHARPADPRRLQAPRRALAAARPSRSCSRAAATSRRSSAPSRPTACCARFFAPRRRARRRPAPRARRAPSAAAAYAPWPARRPRVAQRARAATEHRDGDRAARDEARRRAAQRRRAACSRGWSAAVAGAGPEPHPDRRPRRARPRLHPRDACRALWLLASLYFRGEVRGLGNIPEDGPGPARRQPLRRQPHRPTPASSRSPSAPTSASSGAFYQLAHNLVLSMPGPRLPAQVRHRRRLARERRARRWSPAPRCSSTPAATTRSTARCWERNKVDFDGRKGFIRLALEQDVPIVPVVAIGGQETALFLSARRDAGQAAAARQASAA